ncbi:MAG: sugar ABC transporter ATP-binding protein [Atribacterota bacterium]|nr:sugar ABC transporter ATP-binding protein [Atribacterota bacterium]MDD4895593.1 sugar ABC transporter ATP-binding protein [Atribacterota bacterium]MDD5636844.1 sugar ABC transporter ATP-binding protein [Atribacterota bacterium]
MSKDTIVNLRNICKSFGSTRALRNVNFHLEKGEIHAIIGENGAGKTTLVNILYGLIDKDSGEIHIKGTEYKKLSPSVARKIGIAMIPQKIQLVPELSIGENLFLNDWPRAQSSILIDWDKIQNKSHELLKKLELDLDPTTKVANLSYVNQQIIAITKAFFVEQADIIVLDEPTAPLAIHEIEILFNFIRSLKKSNTTSFIYISHFLDEVLKISDMVTILRDGEVVCCNNTESFTLTSLVKYMVGKETDLYPKRDVNIGDTILQVQNISKKPLFKDVSFNLNKGEILGLYGLKGSGRTELVRIICGLDRFESGQIILKGRKIKNHNVEEAITNGIGYLPEDRIKWGMLTGRSIRENATITFLKKLLSIIGLIEIKKESNTVEKYVKQLNIKLSNIDQRIEELSGGNQQKVMVARLLGSGLEVFILDDPTFGIDIKAKKHIHQIMNDLVSSGKSILLISSAITELIEMSDRIIVLKNGEIIESYGKQDFCKLEAV